MVSAFPCDIALCLIKVPLVVIVLLGWVGRWAGSVGCAGSVAGLGRFAGRFGFWAGWVVLVLISLMCRAAVLLARPAMLACATQFDKCHGRRVLRRAGDAPRGSRNKAGALRGWCLATPRPGLRGHLDIGA